MTQRGATWTDGQPVILDQNGIVQDSDLDKLNAYFKAVHGAVAAQPAVESDEARRLLELVFVEVGEIVNQAALEARKNK